MSPPEANPSIVHGDPASTPALRTMTVLAAFVTQAEWGVRELAARTSLPRSSVNRVLQELAEGGFLRLQNEGSYRVTPALLRFALDLSGVFRAPRLAQPHLDEARNTCGETTVLLLYDRGRRQVAGVAAAESIKPVRYTSEATKSFADLHLGASGKGILAFLPETERERVLADLPDPVPGLVDTSKEDIRKELTGIRHRGWAKSSGERSPGAQGVCAPVYGSAGEVVGGVLIAWPQNNGHEGAECELGELAARTARAISLDIGCPETALPASPG